MKAALADHFDVCETDVVASESIISRLRGLWQRFPSASNGLLSLADQVIVSGASFATSIIVTRSTTPDQVGLYFLTVSIVAVAIGIQDNVVAAPYTIYSKRRQGEELASYAGSAWLHLLSLTGITLLGLLLAIVAAWSTGATNIAPGLWALAGAAPLLLVREGIRRFAFANLHLMSAIAVDAIVVTAQLVGLAALAYYGKLSIFTIYGVMAAACGLACIGWYLFSRPPLRFERSRFMPDWKGNWVFAKWAVRSYLVGSTMPYILPWIIDFSVGTAATGVFGACLTLIGVTNMFLTAVDRVLTPRAAQAFVTGGREDLRRVLILAASFLALTLGGFFLAVWFTGPRLAVLAYGNQFAGSGGILAALSLSALMASLGMVAGIGLWAIEQPRSNFMADVCCLVATIALAAMLVVPFGALGAALATLSGTTIAAIVRTWTLLRALDAPSLAVSYGGSQP